MKIQLAQTLRDYDKKNLPKDMFAGLIIMAVSIPISMGYAQIAGLPAVYGFGIPYSSVCPLFHIAPVHFWRGCGSGGIGRIGVAWYGDRKWIGRGDVCRSGTYLLGSGMALSILSAWSRQIGQLHLSTGHGWFYHGYLYHDHSDAGTETLGRKCRDR